MTKNNKKTTTPILDQYADDPNFISAFARGLIVIEAFSQANGPQTISDLSKTTGFSRATVRRVLYTLLQLGYVSLDGRYYELTSKILVLAHTYLTSQNLPNMAQPILESITKELDEASSMAVLIQNEIIYTARSSDKTHRIMSNTLSVGSHLPAYCTSMGRVLLAALPEEEQKEVLQNSQLKAYTPYTLYNEEELLEELKTIADQGYALVNQELELGLCSIAVPLIDKTGKVVAAINTSTHALRNRPEEVLEKFLPVLQNAAQLLQAFI